MGTPRSQKIRALEMKLSKTKAVNTQLEAQVQKHQEEAQHALEELNQSKALLEGTMKLKEESNSQMQNQTTQNSNEMMKFLKPRRRNIDRPNRPIDFCFVSSFRFRYFCEKMYL